MTKRIIAYLLFILGFFIFAFFSKYNGGKIPYPIVFWIIGGAMWIGGFILIRNSRTFREEKKDKQVQDMIAELKASGTHIAVNFSDCEIRENTYTTEKRRSMDDSILFRMMKPNIESSATGNVNVNQSVIVFPLTADGKKEMYVSSIIPKDKVTLLFELTAKKTTILYVDPNNPDRYYFDVSFLHSNS